jgi:phospholipase C
MRLASRFSALVLLLLCLASCTNKTRTAAASAPLPRFGHVFIVVLQDHGYNTVIGNPVMPYFNSLASQYVLLTNYSADSGMSLDNSLYLVTGAGTSDVPYFGKRLYLRDNVVRELRSAGMTWKSYAEGLPRVGYTKEKGFNAPYVKRHNPFPYLADVWLSPTQRKNLVPFSQFPKDLANNALPKYSWIVPTGPHNAHMENCPDGMTTCTDTERLAECDRWLKTNIAPLIASDIFQKDGLLIIVFDDVEGDRPGKVPAVIVSPFSKRGYKSATPAGHESALRLMTEGLGLTRFPGAAKSASNLADCFNTHDAATLPQASSAAVRP